MKLFIQLNIFHFFDFQKDNIEVLLFQANMINSQIKQVQYSKFIGVAEYTLKNRKPNEKL